MAPSSPAVAVFADNGPTRFRAVQRQAGATLARRGATLLVSAPGGAWPRHLVDGALAERGHVVMVAAASALPRGVPSPVAIETVAGPDLVRPHLAGLARAFIGLPGGLASVSELYATWLAGGGAASGKPVGLLNRRQAFEVVKGFMGDVAAVGLSGTERHVQFAEDFEELWQRVMRHVPA